MPIRKPNFTPPFNIVRASHVEFGVRDLNASRAFYVDCLGYLITDEDRDAIYLRAVEERNHHSIVLRKSKDADGRRRSATRLRAKRTSTAPPLGSRTRAIRPRSLRSRIRAARCAPATCSACRSIFISAWTRPTACCANMPTYKGARIQRIDHLNCFTPDVQASYDFYTELGFRLTEYTETDGDDPQLWAVWMHRKGNVHDLAFTNGRGPRLHHIGVWTASSLDILHICDVMASSGYLVNMERGPGRHGISNAFFLYIRDPDGHRVELFTSDYLTVDPDFEPLRWALQDAQRQTLWGHPAPKSWFEEGSTFTGVPVREPVLEAQPIVAR